MVIGAGTDRPRDGAGVLPAGHEVMVLEARPPLAREDPELAPPPRSRRCCRGPGDPRAASRSRGARWRLRAAGSASWCGTGNAPRSTIDATHRARGDRSARPTSTISGWIAPRRSYDTQRDVKVDRRPAHHQPPGLCGRRCRRRAQFTHVANYHAGNRAAERLVSSARHGQSRTRSHAPPIRIPKLADVGPDRR